MPNDVNSLYALALSGDATAAEQLFHVLGVSFRMFVRHRVLNRQDCEEIVQDSLATIVEKYRGVQIESSFSGWAYKVLSNKILDFYKYKGVRAGKILLLDESTHSTTEIPLDPELKARLLDCLRKIHGINSFHARALNLHYQGYGTSEISAKFGITPNNFYVMLSRARAMLKGCLEEGDIKS
jgi:RNA polymerase sigma factor (sigma-70 family)